MLPFLAKKKNDAGIAGTIIQNRKPDEHNEPQDDGDSDEQDYSKEDCAKDILHAIKTNDHALLASALEELIQNIDKEPHEEGPHIEPHSYDSQNQKAGQE